MSMTFIIGIFQSHCKSEHSQVKWNKITRDMHKSVNIFPYLQCTYLNGFWHSWSDLSKKRVITGLEEKCTSFNFIL